jgi:hypothetical protein
MMKRPARILRLLLTAGLAMAALPASALERNFPDTIKRARVTPSAYPAIVINGKVRNLSAGARIWNEDNMIELPASLRGSGMPANYTENGEGDIDRVWLLSPEEARIPLPKPVTTLRN